MKHINLLGAEVYNRIAAGEVVDGPYSVVKELIENSLDAGATEIEVRIVRAGKELIEISDNGSGIYEEDLRSAFLPHATSKISKPEDLDSIETLGFRGEALASISSVSKCEIVSRVQGFDAHSISCDGKCIGETRLAALEKGTVVTVRDLFFNTPARAKFLQTDKKETSSVTACVTRYILGNPSVSFKYYVDGKITLESFGEGTDACIAEVYGAATLSQCIKINGRKGDIRVSGYVSNQNFFKSNKSYQSVFVNGRWIQNNTISVAVTAAYSYYAMKRQYPFYVLYIEMPKDSVDVNVHPSKADVRFIDKDAVFSAVYGIISSVLDGTSRAADFVAKATYIPEIRSSLGGSVYSSEKKEKENENGTDSYGFGGYTVGSSPSRQGTSQSLYRDAPDDDGEEFAPFAVSSVPHAENPVQNAEVAQESGNYVTGKVEQQEVILNFSRYAGVLFNTFLIYEVNDEVYLIDQHAAHERLLFDSYREKIRERSVVRQGMLMPYVLTLTPAEFEFVSDNLDVLEEAGFDITQFGPNSFKVSEVPSDLIGMDVRGFFDELLTDINSLKTVKMEDVLRDRIAMAACKSAIKGGDELTDDEKDRLFKMLGGDMGLKCPHGRPICVKITRRDLEKMFKRIV